jgi:hypothetical protein
LTPACAPPASSCSRAAGRRPAAELGGGRGLARALQARQQDDGRRPGRELEGLRLGPAEHLDHLVADHPEDGLVRGQAPEDVLAFRAGADPVHDLLRDLEVHVRLEEGQADLTERGLDLGLGEDPLAPEGLEDPLEPFAQRFEHAKPTLRLADPKPNLDLTGSGGGLSNPMPGRR